MPFKPTQEQKDKLAELGSNYKFINRGPIRKRMDHGEMEVVDPAFVLCELRDQVTGNAWAEGRGDDRASALANVLALANPANKPRTAAEIAAENVVLREQLEAMKAQDAKAAEAKPKPKQAKKPKSKPATKAGEPPDQPPVPAAAE